MSNESRHNQEPSSEGGKVIPFRKKAGGEEEVIFDGIDLTGRARFIKKGESPPQFQINYDGIDLTSHPNCQHQFIPVKSIEGIDSIQNGPEPGLVHTDEIEIRSGPPKNFGQWKKWAEAQGYYVYVWDKPRGLRGMYLEIKSRLRQGARAVRRHFGKYSS